MKTLTDNASKFICSLMRAKTRDQIRTLEINNIFLIDDFGLYECVKSAYKRADTIRREQMLSYESMLN